MYHISITIIFPTSSPLSPNMSLHAVAKAWNLAGQSPLYKFNITLESLLSLKNSCCTLILHSSFPPYISLLAVPQASVGKGLPYNTE